MHPCITLEHACVRASGVVFCKSVNSLVFSLSCFLTKPKGRHGSMAVYLACNATSRKAGFACWVLRLLSNKSHGKHKKNLISRCFNPFYSTFFQPGVFIWTRNNRHHSDIGPTPVLRSSTRSHVRDQIGMPSLKKTPFDHVCFFSWQVCQLDLEDLWFPINQCDPARIPVQIWTLEAERLDAKKRTNSQSRSWVLCPEVTAQNPENAK